MRPFARQEYTINSDNCLVIRQMIAHRSTNTGTSVHHPASCNERANLEAAHMTADAQIEVNPSNVRGRLSYDQKRWSAQECLRNLVMRQRSYDISVRQTSRAQRRTTPTGSDNATSADADEACYVLRNSCCAACESRFSSR